MAYDAGLASGGLATEAARKASGYVMLGTRDLARAQRFYDVIAREIGVGRTVEADHLIAWGQPGFGVALSEFAARGGGMAPLQAEDPEQVRRLYEIALEHGGVGEGAPADHGGGFYAAYFRDPDGNRINAFCMTRQ